MSTERRKNHQSLGRRCSILVEEDMSDSDDSSGKGPRTPAKAKKFSDQKCAEAGGLDPCALTGKYPVKSTSYNWKSFASDFQYGQMTSDFSGLSRPYGNKLRSVSDPLPMIDMSLRWKCGCGLMSKFKTIQPFSLFASPPDLQFADNGKQLFISLGTSYSKLTPLSSYFLLYCSPQPVWPRATSGNRSSGSLRRRRPPPPRPRPRSPLRRSAVPTAF